MDWCGGISLRLDCIEKGLSLHLAFFLRAPCIVHGASKYNIHKKKLKKKTLKLGPTQYYLYLKIILLQYY